MRKLITLATYYVLFAALGASMMFALVTAAESFANYQRRAKLEKHNEEMLAHIRKAQEQSE